jgi:hypothetical protein
MGGLKGQGMNLGMMASPLLTGGLGTQGDATAGQPEESTSLIRPYTFNPKTQRYTAQTPVPASEWGTRTFPGYQAGGQVNQNPFTAPQAPQEAPIPDDLAMTAGMANFAFRDMDGTSLVPVGMPQQPTQGGGGGGGISQATQQAIGSGAQTAQPMQSAIVAPTAANTAQTAFNTSIAPPSGRKPIYNPNTSKYEVGMASGGSVGIAAAPKFQAGGEMESDAFVVPADVVSAFGNGSTAAGVRRLNEYFGLAIPIEGEGDGLSDDIPASIEGGQPARVADGEVYLPPEIVAQIGDGDPERGAAKLYTMMDKIREAAHGKQEQQAEVAPEQVMPA